MPGKLSSICGASAICAIVCFFATASAFAAESAGKTIYVAPDGKDSASGAEDSPLATLEGARNLIRVLKKDKGLPAGGVTVELRGGVYERSSAFALTKEDSGTEKAPIVYRARQGDNVRLLGGKVVNEWTEVKDAEALKRLPDVAKKQVLQASLSALGIKDFGNIAKGGLELFFNNQPMNRSRWPDTGFANIASVTEEGAFNLTLHHKTGSRVGKFHYDGDQPSRWQGEQDIWAFGYWFWDWSEEVQRVASVDPATKLITLEPNDGKHHSYGYRDGQRYCVYNSLAELNRPGDWQLNTASGTIYFWPPQKIEAGQAVVSVLQSLVDMDNVEQVTIQGLVLEATRGTPVNIKGGERCQLVGCTIRNTGEWAVNIEDGSAHAVVGCDIYATAEGCVKLTGGDRKTLTHAKHLVENCHFYNWSRWKRTYQGAVDIKGVGTTVRRNLMHDAPHLAIRFLGNEHLIEGNEIHSVCYETGDASAIYTGRDWTFGGTVICGNYIHHVNGPGEAGTIGVYLDDMASGISVTGNIFQQVGMAMLYNSGRNIITKNNLLIGCPVTIKVSDLTKVGWAQEHIKTTLPRLLKAMPIDKEPWSSRYPYLQQILNDPYSPACPRGTVIKTNLFVNCGPAKIAKTAVDVITMENNPEIKSQAFDDKNSPRVAMPDNFTQWPKNFEMIAFDKIGLYEDNRRASWPVVTVVRTDSFTPKETQRPKSSARPKRTTKAPAIDGKLNAEEWALQDASTELALQIQPNGKIIAKNLSLAYLLFDDDALYVGMRNLVANAEKIDRSDKWGVADGVEVGIRPVSGNAGGSGPVRVLHGFTSGKFEASAEAGDSAAAEFQQAVTYAASQGKNEWTCEFRIPWKALGVDLENPEKVQFNLGVLKSSPKEWLAWMPTGAESWKVENAGQLELGVPLPVGAKNLAANPAFEQGENKPEKWNKDETGNAKETPEAEREPKCQWVAEGLAGSKCLKISSLDDAKMKERAGSYRQTIPVEIPGKYLLSYQLRGEGINALEERGGFLAAAHIVFKDGKHGPNLGETESRLTEGSFSWTRREHEVIVPNTAATVQLVFMLKHAVGTVWIDNVALHKLNN